MPIVDRYATGTFCWVDLGTPNLAAARSFYRALFGWSLEELPGIGAESAYTLARLRGEVVAGLFAQPPEQRAEGDVAQWLAYVAVEDAQAVVRKARPFGAKLVVPPFTVPGYGIAALLRDPSGAPLALWQPLGLKGARLVREPGTFCWTELATADVDAAGRFYSRLFGWVPSVERGPLGNITVFHLHGRALASMRPTTVPGSSAAATDPHWLVYFTVADCDVALARARELGAAATAGPMDAPGVGRVAVLRDPQGAALALIALRPELAGKP